ncbi:hypothetical protein EDD29_4960 [Actinocorallia herbida]|uniref:Trypsin-co-occurring domain-containing protein n=1 Tax=Actinocorallia herbida TaxID=58109 RepID=A0A3N1D1F7_9ACTN|nr:trypco2 family protein [Actinocorallia herbida]ROO87359.1 hypothetical protein EDD29_4960 [Actinocorallia herbida]
MAELGLVEVIEKVREELRAAALAGADADIRFPVEQVTLEFQVGIKKIGEGTGKVKIWVIETGATGKIEHDKVQKVTVVLGTPTGPDGELKVSGGSDSAPG